MKHRSRTLKWLVIVSAVLAIQTATFYFISAKQLKRRLLPEYFQFEHQSDSAYVRDFFGHAEDPPVFTPLSHGLANDEKMLKERLKVKFVYFEQPGEEKQRNEMAFNLVYHTWMERGDWLVLWNLFRVKQVEALTVDQTTVYYREVIYQWCLFFWIRSTEFIQSDCHATGSRDYFPGHSNFIAIR